MPRRILLQLPLAIALLLLLLVTLPCVVESKELPDWNEHMLDCFQDMRNADHDHDLKLSSAEFKDFTNRYANRIFVSQNVVKRGNFWQLQELFEELCLVNPGDPQGNTLTIAGAEVIQSKAALDDKGSLYLQKICEQAEKVLRQVGPQQAVSDRKGEKCNVHNTVIVYHGTNNDVNKAAKTKEETKKLEQLKEEYTHVGNGTYLSGNWTLLEDSAKEVDETDIVLAETFHDISNNRTWIREDFKDGHEIEEWEGAPDEDEEITSSYMEPLPNLAVTLFELFGWEAHIEEEAKAEEGEEKEKTRYLRRVAASTNDEDAVDPDE